MERKQEVIAGKSHPHDSAVGHVTGAARYVDDMECATAVSYTHLTLPTTPYV